MARSLARWRSFSAIDCSTIGIGRLVDYGWGVKEKGTTWEHLMEKLPA